MKVIFKNTVTRFRKDESGAVTVDWIVLTAALVGLGFSVMTSVASGATEIASDVSQCTRIIRNQLVRDHNESNRSWEWRLARAQRNCGRQ